MMRRLFGRGPAFLVFCGACLLCSPLPAGTRVAIIVDSDTGSVPSVVTAAEKVLADSKAGVELVGRSQINKAVDDQRQEHRPGADDTPSTVGKAVSADLVAVVEQTPDGDSVDGLVIFDARSGLRLEDVALPADPKDAAEMLDGRIEAAVTKRNLPNDQRRPVCLMTPRNVDLPPELADLCQVTGRLVERRLTDSSTVSVLERARLANVAAEQPGADAGDLAPSLTTVELQIAVAGDNRIRVTCLLTDPTGKAVGSPSVTGPVDDAGVMADRAADAIFTAIKAQAAPAAGNRHAEAMRFAGEARFRWSHRQRQAALEDVAAAFALDPKAPGIQIMFARALLERGAEFFIAFDDTDAEHLQGFPYAEPKPDQADLSVNLVARGAVMLNSAIAAIPAPTTAPTTGPVTAEADQSELASHDRMIAEKVIRTYLAGVGCQSTIAPTQQGIRHVDLSAEDKKQLDRIRTEYRHLRMVVEQPDAVAAVHDSRSFNAYTDFLFDLLSDSTFCFSKSVDEWTQDLAALIPAWVDLAEKYDKVDSRTGMRTGRGPAAGNHREDPSARLLNALCNGWPGGQMDWAGVSFPFNKRPMGWGNFSDNEFDRLEAVFESLSRHRERMFVQSSDAGIIWVARTRWEQSHAGEPPQKHRSPELLPAAIDRMPGPTVEEQAGKNTQLNTGGAGLFWKQARTLIDVTNGDSPIRTVFNPYVVDGMIYCAAFADETEGPTLEVLKFDPSDGTCTVLGRRMYPNYAGIVRKPTDSLHDRLSQIRGYGMAKISDGNYLMQGQDGGLIIFPLAGGDPVVLDQKGGLPARFVQDAAMLGGKLYLSIGTGLLVEFDPKTRESETIASAERKEHVTPLDDSPAFQIGSMVADKARDRIVFFASSKDWTADKCGVYEYDRKTKTVRPLMLDDKPPAGTTQPVDGAPAAAATAPRPRAVLQYYSDIVDWDRSTIIVAKVGSWSAGFDVGKNKPVPFPGEKIPQGFGEKVEITRTREAQGPWIWTGVSIGQKWQGHASFGRIDTDKKRFQVFPPLRPFEISGGMWPVYLATVDDRRMLVGDQYGMWVVEPPDGFATPAGVLEEPSRAVVEKRPASLPPFGGRLPWTAGETLYDYVLTQGDYDFIVRPAVHGEFVYALGLGHDGPASKPGQGYVQLLKYSTVKTERKQLGKAALAAPTWPLGVTLDTQSGIHHGERVKNSFSFVTATTFSQDSLFCAIPAGLFEFPLDGSPARQVGQRAAVGGGMNSLAFLDGSLYFAAGSRGGAGTRLTRLDLKADSAEPVGANIGGKPPAPFDGGGVYIPFVCADSAKNRIVFVAADLPGPQKSGGIWSYDIKAGTFTRLLPLFLTVEHASASWIGSSNSFRWAALTDDHTLLLATWRGMIRFDLNADQAVKIQQVSKDFDVLAQTGNLPATVAKPTGNDLLDGLIGFFPPVTTDDKWIWCVFPFGRISLDGKTWQAFPPLRNGDSNFVPTEAVQLFDGGKRMLIADNLGCWILELGPTPDAPPVPKH